MAQIQQALTKTLAFEGGYVFDKTDKGGETYKGISRVNFPNWSGWKDVDNYKRSYVGHSLDAMLQNNIQVQQSIESFYKTNFWDRLGGDQISSQVVANNIFDFAVNSGVKRASQYAQRVAGVIDDGIIGKNSINAINALDASSFIAEYKNLREAFLHSIAANNPTQLKFLNGWLNRVQNA